MTGPLIQPEISGPPCRARKRYLEHFGFWLFQKLEGLATLPDSIRIERWIFI